MFQPKGEFNNGSTKQVRGNETGREDRCPMSLIRQVRKPSLGRATSKRRTEVILWGLRDDSSVVGLLMMGESESLVVAPDIEGLTGYSD